MMISLWRKLLILPLIVLVAVGFLMVYVVWAYNPGTNFTLCTSTVNQPACYSGAYPTPTVNWTVVGSSAQQRYQVQIDNNIFFSSPDIDTGWVVSANKFYTVSSAGLSFNTQYYWRVRIRDNFSSISNWAQETAVGFVTNGVCNSAPSASGLSVTGILPSYYCTAPSHFFSWTYTDPDSDNESRYEFQVDNNSNFSSPEVNMNITGLSNPSPATNNQTVIVSASPGANQIAYNTTYYWRVRVYDDAGANSGWVSGPSFATAKHQFPTINFIWSPNEPSEEEDVSFTDQSTTYGGATKSAWSWTFQDGNPNSSSVQNPVVQFLDAGYKDTTLTVTDSDGYECDDTQQVHVQWRLPDWRELLPF